MHTHTHTHTHTGALTSIPDHTLSWMIVCLRWSLMVISDDHSSLTLSFTQQFITLLTRPFARSSPTHSLTHSLPHCLTHFLAYLLADFGYGLLFTSLTLSFFVRSCFLFLILFVWYFGHLKYVQYSAFVFPNFKTFK